MAGNKESKFDPGDLDEIEIFWRDHYDFLKGRGYTLRPRYEPGWVPSWLKTEKCEGSSIWDLPYKVEDANQHYLRRVMDAERSDGSVVILKKVPVNEYSNEVHITKLLSSPSLSKDPKNHCVPILDIISPREGSQFAFIVMPYLLDVNNPCFETIGEALGYLSQILEGIQFMHANNVVHGDCEFKNIMADTVPLFNEVPHPSDISKSRDFQREVHPITSRTKRPVKYYIINSSDSSVVYDRANEPPLKRPPGAAAGTRKEIPEFMDLSTAPTCNPFAMEVFSLGAYIRNHYLDGGLPSSGGYFLVKPKQGFEFMRGLVDDMTQKNLEKCPSMPDVVSRFEALIKNLDDVKLRSPFLEVGQKMGILRGLYHWITQLVYRFTGIPAIPRA
ncbi:hypothetical protein H0H93_012288 [Arthromyces matolae]|nr:hypothetical protein H0H93_012288 [Arthromyces matolae]